MLQRVSPIVAADPPGGIVIESTGAGGEAGMIETLIGRLAISGVGVLPSNEHDDDDEVEMVVEFDPFSYGPALRAGLFPSGGAACELRRQGKLRRSWHGEGGAR